MVTLVGLVISGRYNNNNNNNTNNNNDNNNNKQVYWQLHRVGFTYIQYKQAYKIQGNTNATQRDTSRDTQRDTYKEYIFR